MEGAVDFSNDVWLFSGEINFLIELGITIVFPYSYLPSIFLLAYMAELISL